MDPRTPPATVEPRVAVAPTRLQPLPCDRLPPLPSQVRGRWWRAPRIPWTLYRYTTLEVVRITILAVLAVSLLCSAIAAYQTVRSGIQLAFLWPFLAKTFAYPLFFSLPIALLFGVSLTKGRMVADLEVDAIRCHGGSHLQLYFPVLALGVVATLASHWFNGWVLPEIHYEKRNLQEYILRQLENLGSGQNRTILLPEGGGSLFVGKYEGLELHRVRIDLRRELQSRFVPNVRSRLPEKLPEKIILLALDGRIEITEDRRGVHIHLRSVDILVPEKISGSRTGDDRFIQKFSISDSVSIPLSFERRGRGVKDLDNQQLHERIGKLEARLALHPHDESAAHQVLRSRAEWHRRLAYSLSAFTFPLIAISLCFLLDMRGRLVPFFASGGLVLCVYYPLLMVGSYLADEGVWPALSYAIPNLALLVVAALLARKVVRR